MSTRTLGLLAVAALLLGWACGRAAADEERKTAPAGRKRGGSLRITPLRGSEGVRISPLRGSKGVRITPLQRDRSIRHRPSAPPGGGGGHGGASPDHGDDGSHHGGPPAHRRFVGFWWIDEDGRFHQIIPHNRAERRLLERGFVSNRILYLFNRHRRRPRHYWYVPYAGSRVYRFSIYVESNLTYPDDYEILQPKPAPKAQARPASQGLWTALGGRGQEAESFVLGEAFMKQGQFAEAIQQFSKTVAKRPDDAVAALALGLALMANGELERSAEWLRTSLTRHQRPEAIDFNPRLAFGDADVYARALESAIKGLEEDEARAGLQLVLGFHHFVAGDWDKSIEHLWQAERLDPTDLASARLRALATGQLAAQQATQQAEEEAQTPEPTA